MAKTKAALELEYQEVLKVSQSLIGGINKMIDETAAKQNNVTEAAKKQNIALKSINNNIKEYSDIDNAILEVAKEKLKINDRFFGINQKMRPLEKAKLDTQIKLYQTERLRGIAIEQADSAAKHLSESLGGALDGISSGLGEIPLVGNMLKKLSSGPVDSLKKTFGTAAKSFTADFGGAMKSGKTGMEALKIAGGNTMNFLKMAVNPVVIGMVLLGAAIAYGVKRFTELDKAAKGFRETTGLLNSQTHDIQSNIQGISRDMAIIGVSAEDVSKSMATWTNEFDGLEQASVGVTKSMLVMNKNFGVGITEATKLNKIFQNMSGVNAEGAQSLVSSTVSMAKLAGVAPQKVIADMAENSETAYKYFNGSPKALAKAAVHAAKLGTSLTSAAKTAEGLLDFESSITNELELGAMLGARVNFAKARQLAYDGKIVESQQAIMDQVSNLGDINKMGVFQKEALVKATGMELTELVNQQGIRQRFGKLDEKQLESAMALLETGKEISEISQKDLKDQTAKMKNQHEMQSQMDLLHEKSGAIGTAFMDMLEPLGSFLMPIITDVVGLLGDVLIPAFRVIGGLFKIVFGALGMVWDLIMAIIKPIVYVGRAITEYIQTPFNLLADKLYDVFSIFGHAGDDIIAWFQGLGQTITSFINEITYDLVNMLPDWLADFITGDTSISANVTESKQVEQAGSINDGIVQNGNIISTHPDDTIFATKTPETLMSGNRGGGKQDNTQLITKLDELINAVNKNKDVYLDREKVTGVVMRTSEKSTGNVFGLGVA